MNKILELAKPHIMHERFTRYGESIEEDFYEFYPDELVQFAESIVKQCAEFARQHNLRHADRSHMIHKAIEQHFGVE